MGVENYTVKHFNKSTVQEIALNNPDYPQRLKAIRKPPKSLRVCGNLPPHAKIEGVTLVENLGELKDALGIVRDGLN